MSELALRLIEENKKTRAPFLDLGNCGLTEVPAEIGELVWLEGLSFAAWRKDDAGLKESSNVGQANNIKVLLSSVSCINEYDANNSSIALINPFSYLINLKHLWLNIFYEHKSELTDLLPLAELVNLQSLDISKSQVKDLSALANLINLKVLNISKTKVEDLSPLAKVVNLEMIDFSDTKVSDLSPITNLANLQKLCLKRTQVSDLSPIANLSNLKVLIISETKVTDLSPLASLPRLENLNVKKTNICDLTPLAGLAKLKYCIVSNTKVSDLFPLAGLWRLLRLDVSDTKVNDLKPLLILIKQGFPVYWARWQDGVCVKDCPISIPPVEVVKQGNAAILNYFKETESQGVDHLYEAKLLIVGEGGSGKTSLLRRLYQPEKTMPEEYETTKGIEVYHHEFKYEGIDFRLNVWDFGGQEVYHATHQFFLTKRSLYILLDDTRKDQKTVHDEGFKYWLEVVDQLSDHSPVLIFQNEKGGRSKTIDEAGIKGHFKNVMDVFRGNLEHKNAADRLKIALEYYASQLPHIGEELPKLWVSIRADIETQAKQKPYISQQEYFDLYTQYLEFDRVKALHLSRYFHDLGVFLHFQEDALLARTVILQNTWATEAVFKMLDDEIVKQVLGRFSLQDCQRVWQDSVYADMHLELLALMQKFELCYRLPDANPEIWLAPQLSPPSKPKELANWEQAGDLVLRYRYEFMPKGLISRLMVRLHRFVPQPDLGWVTGVLFERERNQVLVEIPPKGGEITMRARGPERKELLSVIAADLDALNESFHGLRERVEKLVPCNCEQCLNQAGPNSYELTMLKRFKTDGILKWKCSCSYADVDVLELLDGISVRTLPGWAKKEDIKESSRKGVIPNSSPQKINIFLASSSELRADRDEFELYFLRQNNREQGYHLKIVRWENFLDAMSESRLQNEYNKAVQECDIFVSLFFTKTGTFTEEEFDVAHRQFMATKKPRIYTFFKNAPVNMSNIGEEVLSLLNFKNRLGELGHFYTGYKNIEDLKLQFKDQLEKLLDDTPLFWFPRSTFRGTVALGQASFLCGHWFGRSRPLVVYGTY